MQEAAKKKTNVKRRIRVKGWVSWDAVIFETYFQYARVFVTHTMPSILGGCGRVGGDGGRH